MGSVPAMRPEAAQKYSMGSALGCTGVEFVLLRCAGAACAVREGALVTSVIIARIGSFLLSQAIRSVLAYTQTNLTHPKCKVCAKSLDTLVHEGTHSIYIGLRVFSRSETAQWSLCSRNEDKRCYKEIRRRIWSWRCGRDDLPSPLTRGSPGETVVASLRIFREFFDS